MSSSKSVGFSVTFIFPSALAARILRILQLLELITQVVQIFVVAFHALHLLASVVQALLQGIHIALLDGLLGLVQPGYSKTVIHAHVRG